MNLQRKWTQQPCWTCALACGGCPWTELDKDSGQVRFEPVPGWDAEEVVMDSNGVTIHTYRIFSCPMKVDEPPRKVLNDEEDWEEEEL